jgi:hypothetical protein
MAHECYLCKTNTIFYVWTTSRNFPKAALIKTLGMNTKSDKGKVAVEGLPICFSCLEELKKKKL